MFYTEQYIWRIYNKYTIYMLNIKGIFFFFFLTNSLDILTPIIKIGEGTGFNVQLRGSCERRSGVDNSILKLFLLPSRCIIC